MGLGISPERFQTYLALLQLYALMFCHGISLQPGGPQNLLNGPSVTKGFTMKISFGFPSVFLRSRGLVILGELSTYLKTGNGFNTTCRKLPEAVLNEGSLTREKRWPFNEAFTRVLFPSVFLRFSLRLCGWNANLQNTWLPTKSKNDVFYGEGFSWDIGGGGDPGGVGDGV